MDLAEAEGAMAPQHLLHHMPEIGAAERTRFDRHGWHPARTGLGRPTPADPVQGPIVRLVKSQGTVEELATLDEPRVRFDVEVVQGSDELTALGIFAMATEDRWRGAPRHAAGGRRAELGQGRQGAVGTSLHIRVLRVGRYEPDASRLREA